MSVASMIKSLRSGGAAFAARHPEPEPIRSQVPSGAGSLPAPGAAHR